MSKTEFDRDKPDQESMFDFLSEDDEQRSARKKVARKGKRKSMPAMPTIRKPVPISKSGPLLAPKPGDPVEPPPPLTTGKVPAVSDDLAFLDETRAESPDLSPVSKKGAEKHSETIRPGNVQQANQNSANDEDSDLAREFSSFGRDKVDNIDFDKNWGEGHLNYESQEDNPKERLIRWIAFGGAAILLIGGGSYLFMSGKADHLLSGQSDQTTSLESAVTGTTVSDATASAIETTALETAQVPSTMQRFLDQQSAIEALIGQGSLDEAKLALSSMDRTLYGYGASEFQLLESRIESLQSESGTPSESATNEAEALRLEELKRLEQLALESQAEAQAEEAARLANVELAEKNAAETVRLEQERLAKQAAEVEADRIVQRRFAEEQAEALRIEQAAARLAAQREQDAVRLQAQKEADAADSQSIADASEAARQEQLVQARLASETAAARADKIRLDALEETARDEARRQIAEADRLATDRRIAEDRIAAERRAALEQRLKRTREIEAANAAETARQTDTQSNSRNTVASTTQDQRQSNNASATQSAGRPITDAELQTVYRQFSELQEAIAERDIGQVVNLTERSGLRVQQFMQVFENSVNINVRIRNVSTSNATGEINGTLQIQSIERADGSRAVPPENLESIRISTRRDGNGWSPISW